MKKVSARGKREKQDVPRAEEAAAARVRKVFAKCIVDEGKRNEGATEL